MSNDTVMRLVLSRYRWRVIIGQQAAAIFWMAAREMARSAGGAGNDTPSRRLPGTLVNALVTAEMTLYYRRYRCDTLSSMEEA